MRFAFLSLLAGLILIGTTGASVVLMPASSDVVLPGNLEGDADRGAYVARMAGCIACHTDHAGGSTVLAGGPPLKTPFGTFYAPNITPDPEYGIGKWSIDDFATALRHGVAPSGSPYYPAFPFAFYTKMTDQDLVDLWAAIWTVPAVAQASKPHELGFPFNQRQGLKLWRVLFFEPGAFDSRADRDAMWNRGAYIVQGPGHCGACHTPRNFLGARDAELALHGTKNLPGGDKSPPITPTALRKSGWTHRDLAFALRTGLKPDGDSFGGSMGEVISEGTSFMSDADLQAIATYLMADEQAAERVRELARD